ncbi:MAG: 4,5-DOPA dioxygenase extradiol [Lysobacteraceae bacterium]
MSATLPTTPMPVLFLGHGSPMNAIEDNAWSRSWQALGRELPRPRAILCVSAHWETPGPWLTGSATPPTIHDFGGFPQALFDVQWPAPGDPALAQRVVDLLGEDFGARVDPRRGLEHGAWAVLRPMYPDADVPVVQLGIDTRRPGAWHVALAQRLAPLRDDGVLVVASGDIVHNLRLFDWRDPSPLPWALRFRDRVNALVRDGDLAALADWPALGEDARLSIPTPEHYLPLLYALALARDGDALRCFNDDVTGSLSMTSLLIGHA